MADYSKDRSEEELEPFFPHEVLRHTLLFFLFISAVMLGVLFFPESFQKATDEFSSFQTKPLWFFLPFSYVSGLVGNLARYIVILTLYGLTFITLPFLERSSEKSIFRKPVFLTISIINLVMLLVLGLMRLVA